MIPKPTKPEKATRRISRIPRCQHCKHKAIEHNLCAPFCLMAGCPCPSWTPKRIASKAKIAKPRKGTFKGLVKKLDDAFALYVKERDGAVCVTCGRTITSKQDWHAGHFIGRTRFSLRWDPKNVHSQCGYVCNKVKRGAPKEYALAILDRYGVEEFRRLMRLKQVDRKFTRPEIEELIAALGTGGADFECLYAEKYGL